MVAMIIPRRAFLTGLASLIAAPANRRHHANPRPDAAANFTAGIPSFAVPSSEDPSQWTESDWPIAKPRPLSPISSHNGRRTLSRPARGKALRLTIG